MWKSTSSSKRPRPPRKKPRLEDPGLMLPNPGLNRGPIFGPNPGLNPGPIMNPLPFPGPRPYKPIKQTKAVGKVYKTY